MRSNASTVEVYLSELPTERREAMIQVRQVILKNLPEGYEETMNWGMITYQVPLEIYPDTYNKRPLMYAALASQKNYMAVYLSSIYMDEKAGDLFKKKYRATGKHFNVGKSCVRFKKIEDLPLDLIGQTVAGQSVQTFVSFFKNIESLRKSKR